ncbi:MAG: glycosyltransferase family 4 protein [Bacteroidales bacterium]|nr:glycosyltransferase family 4 protein [Bacteroidales bacterium]
MEEKKIHVVWICHFSNIEIQEKLRVRKPIAEFAPWITLGIEEAKKRNDIELHIVSPHRWIQKDKEFIENSIHYHFFNPGVPFYGRHWPGFFRFDFYTNFFFNRRKIKKFVRKIKPDIIHLHGAENAYYSASFFDLEKKYPILVTIQGLVSTIKNYHKENKIINNRIKIEKNILQKAKNFGVRTDEMFNEVKKINPEANYIWHDYFLNNKIEKGFKDEEKQYDIIFFARLTVEKGIEDLIVSIGKLKAVFPKIKVAVVGGAGSEYMKRLKNLTIEHNCEENIYFLGHFISQKDVHKILLKSKICVLPVYEDTIPGTIIESMYRKIPVVSYKTGDIPVINKNDEIVLLSEKGDIKGLTHHIRTLLDDATKRDEIANKAYDYAHNHWSNKKALDNIMNGYHKIIMNYR